MKKLIVLLLLVATPAFAASIITRGAYSAYPFGFMGAKKAVPNVAYANVGSLAVNGSGSSVSVSLPSSTGTNDLLILTAVGYRASSNFSTPSGWTLIGNTNGCGSSWCNYVSVFYQKYAGGGAPTISGSGVVTAGIIARVTGANLTTPIGAVGSFSLGSSAPVTTTGVTTTANNSLVMLSMSSVNGTGATFSTPSGWTAAFASYTPAFEIAAVTLAGPSSGTATGSTSSTDAGCCGGAIWTALQFEILHR